MALKGSTGLRNYMLDTGSLKAGFAAGFIKIYSGTPPAAADDAIAGGNTLLCTISSNGTGTGINFDTAAAAGVIAKAPGETWKGTNAASGTATFYRHVAAGDTGALSTTERRMQGTISTAGADMNLSSVALISGAEQKIDYYVVNLPNPT
jgi:hypothetical protein